MSGARGSGDHAQWRWALAALRHRRGQAVGVLVLAFLVGACIVLVPLATRSLEQGVVKPAVTLRPAVESALIIDAGLQPASAPQLDEAAALFGPGMRGVYPRGITDRRAPGTTPVFPAPAPENPATLLVRDDICAHLRFAAGRCPEAANEIAVSEQDSAAYGWTVGATRPFTAQGLTDPRAQRAGTLDPASPGQVSLRIVGAYRQVPADSYWLGAHLGGNHVIVLDRGVALDPFVTVPATLGPAWVAATSREYPADPAALTIDTLPLVRAEIGDAQARAAAGTLFRGRLDAAQEEVEASAAQVRRLVPLVLGQLAALVVAVLFAVARAAADERRGEAALARLRGGGARGARMLLLGELLPPVVVGVLAGSIGAVGIDALLRSRVLPPGVPAEIGASTVAAVLVGALVAALAVTLAVGRVARQPVAALLHRLPLLPVLPGSIGVGTWVALALSVAAVVVLRTSSEPTPLALAAPTLVAFAVGLVAAGLVVRFGSAAATRARRRGRVAAALGWAGAARRPAGRLVVVITAIATASAIVAVNAAVVGARNRALRAELEAGAPYALQVATYDLDALVDLVHAADPSGTAASVVAVTRPADAGAPATLAVDPRQLRTIAFPSAVPAELASLTAGTPGLTPRVAPLRLSGTTLSATLRTDLTGLPPQWGVLVNAVLTTSDGRRLNRTLGVLPDHSPGAVTLRAPLLCEGSCRLDRLEFTLTRSAATSDPRAAAAATGRIHLLALGVDGRSVGADQNAGWQSWADPDRSPASADPSSGPFIRIITDPAAGSAPGALVLEVSLGGGPAALPRADVPEPLPALLAGLPNAGGVSLAKGITDAMLSVRRVGSPDQLPLLGDRGVLVDRTVLGLRGASLGSRDSAEVWFAAGSDTARSAVRDALAAAGMQVTGERDVAAIRARYDASGSAWGLALAVVTALLSLVVAVCFTVVAAVLGWRRAAADSATLRLAGVPSTTLRAAGMRERGTLVVVGLAAGVLAGVVGAVLVMPLFPLFTRPPIRPVPRLTPDALAVGLTVLVIAVTLGAAVVAAAHVVLSRSRLRLVAQDA